MFFFRTFLLLLTTGCIYSFAFCSGCVYAFLCEQMRFSKTYRPGDGFILFFFFSVIFLYILPPIQFVDDRFMLATIFHVVFVVVFVIQTADIFCLDNARTSTVLAFYLLQFISVYFCFLLFLPILQCCIWYYTTAKPCELVVCLPQKKCAKVKYLENRLLLLLLFEQNPIG